MNTKLPLPPHFTSLASALVTLFGADAQIIHTDRLGGGDINKAYGLTLSDGRLIFMKANAKENVSFFTAEAAGLSAIASTGAIGTPKILCTGTDNGEEVGYSFLLLEFIESRGRRTDYWETLGRELAAFHNSPAGSFAELDCSSSKPFGFYQDNFIGARPQKNTPSASWISFFRDSRLLPKFEAAASNFTKEQRSLNTKLMDHLEQFLIEPDQPSLLHGDLWGGNVLCGPEGKALLIDPAVYVGHREADLAMTELFGGFQPEFYSAYREAAPLQPGYEERRDLYNLYHLLNHLDMFGESYLGPVCDIVRSYVG